MKFQISFKDPDGVSNSIQEAINDNLPKDLDENEFEELTESRKILIEESTKRWIKWGEYVTIEIDTEENTCVVVPAN
jgi:hypothetical protein